MPEPEVVILSEADYRLIRNARVYGGIFWAVLGLGGAMLLSMIVAREYTDLLQMALSIPTLAYLIIYCVDVFRRWRKHKPVEKPD
jgi:hypothetical protein